MAMAVQNLIAALLLLFLCSSLQKISGTQEFNVTVAIDGSGDYHSISEAILQAPTLSELKYTIKIEQGIYHEILEIPSNKTNLVFIGDGADRTKITGNRSFRGGYSTYGSATIAIKGDGFVAKFITFENSADWSEGMAVAVVNEANQSAFYNCSIRGYQDTLYANQGFQFYRECDIYGTVDFIFGNARAVFQNCNLYANLPNGTITFTAQSRQSNLNPSGYVIHNSTLTLAPEILNQVAGNNSNTSVRAFLGRPWSDYSTVMVMESWLDSIIDPRGWSEWDRPLNELTYLEYNNRGPGSNTRKRVTWPGVKVLTEIIDVMPYRVVQFLGANDWLPSTGIPYDPGFVQEISFSPSPGYIDYW